MSWPIADVRLPTGVRSVGQRNDLRTCGRPLEALHPGYLGGQDTYYVGLIKAIGRFYQHTFIDTKQGGICEAV